MLHRCAVSNACCPKLSEEDPGRKVSTPRTQSRPLFPFCWGFRFMKRPFKPKKGTRFVPRLLLYLVGFERFGGLLL